MASLSATKKVLCSKTSPLKTGKHLLTLVVTSEYRKSEGKRKTHLCQLSVYYIHSDDVTFPIEQCLQVQEGSHLNGHPVLNFGVHKITASDYKCSATCFIPVLTSDPSLFLGLDDF